MAKYSEIDWLPILQHNRTAQYHDGDTSWSGQAPRTANVTTSAGQMLSHVVDTATIFNDVLTKWSEFAEGYGGADRETVLTALHTTAEEIEAFQAAAKLFHDAVVAYDDSVQTALGPKFGYDTWAADWTRRYREVDHAPAFLTDDAEPGAKTSGDLRQELESERMWNEATGLKVGDDIASARATAASTIEAIDLEELADLRFTIHTAGLDSMGSVEEIEFSLLNNALFGDQLTVADARRIAGQIDIDSLPYTYIDPNGVKWVRIANGEMVVVGSAMDPNLQSHIMTTLAEDPYTQDIEVNLGPVPQGMGFGAELGLSAGEEVTMTISDLLNKGGITGGGIVTGAAAATILLSSTLFSAGTAGNEFAYTMNSSHLLLTTDQKDEISAWAGERDIVIAGASTVAGVAASTVLLVFVPGAGWVATTAVNSAASTGVSALLESQWDSTQSQASMLNTMDDGLPDEFTMAEYEDLIAERQESEGTSGGGGTPAMRSAQ